MLPSLHFPQSGMVSGPAPTGLNLVRYARVLGPLVLSIEGADPEGLPTAPEYATMS